MPEIPFCGQTYLDQNLDANAQDSINLFPMKTPKPEYSNVKVGSGLPPQDIIMYPTPGYKFAQSCANQATSTQTPIRAFYVINNILYIICGNVLLQFTPAGSGSDLTSGSFATLGTLNTSTGQCSIVCNTVQLAISDGRYGYTFTLATGAFAIIPSTGSFPNNGGVTNFTYFDDYVVGAVNNSKQVIQSNVLDASIFGAQAFVDIGTFPDNIIGVFSDELQLYVFGPRITEVQSDAGTIPYAFQKISGVLIQAGCVSVNTICKFGNTIIWLASDINRKCYVASLDGYGTKILSTPPINQAMQNYAIINDAFAYTSSEGDNLFYHITFPTAGVSWVYDGTMDMWHKRTLNGGVDLPVACIKWQGNNVVGDANGSLYLMSQNYSTYSNSTGTVDTPLSRTRCASHIVADGKAMTVNELWIDVNMGGGFIVDSLLNPQPTAPAPLATLFVSKNRGKTWINVGTRSMGAQGQYSQRLRWATLGRFKHFCTFKLVITDPVKTYITRAFANIKVGKK